MMPSLYPAHWIEAGARRVGYIDKTGSVGLCVHADAAFAFSEQRARIKRAGKIGVIDAQGNTILDCVLASASDFRFGWSVASIDGVERGLLDRAGKWVVPPQPRELAVVSTELYCSKEAGEDGWYLRDLRGKKCGGPFPFRAEVVACGRIRVLEESGCYRYLDTRGKQAIAGDFPIAFDFSENQALVSREERWHYIDPQGITTIEHLEFSDFPNGSCFHQGLAAVGRLAAKGRIDYFYIGTDGDVALGPFGAAKDFTVHGAAACEAGTEKWGLIDQEGKWLARPEWFLLDSFSGDLARAFREAPIRGKAHYLDCAGRIVWIDGKEMPRGGGK